MKQSIRSSIKTVCHRLSLRQTFSRFKLYRVAHESRNDDDTPRLSNRSSRIIAYNIITSADVITQKASAIYILFFDIRSTLSLLVFGILTDNSDGSLSPDYFALFANWFNRRSNLHNLHSFQKSPTD